jgi:hypothetical protein
MGKNIQNNLREVMYKEEQSSIKAEISPERAKIPKASIEHAYVTPICTQYVSSVRSMAHRLVLHQDEKSRATYYVQ